MYSTFLSELNWLAIFIAAIAYFALGALWFSVLFGKRWVAYHKINMDDPNAKKGVAATMFTSFVLMFIVCIGLAILVERLDLTTALSGLKLGWFTGLFFSVTAISITYLYLMKPMGIHMIDGFYHMAGQIVSAIILCLWR